MLASKMLSDFKKHDVPEMLMLEKKFSYQLMVMFCMHVIQCGGVLRVDLTEQQLIDMLDDLRESASEDV